MCSLEGEAYVLSRLFKHWVFFLYIFLQVKVGGTRWSGVLRKGHRANMSPPKLSPS